MAPTQQTWCPDGVGAVIPDVVGVQYSVNGREVDAGGQVVVIFINDTPNETWSFTVTAQALDGYELTGTTDWSFTGVLGETCPVEPTPSPTPTPTPSPSATPSSTPVPDVSVPAPPVAATLPRTGVDPALIWLGLTLLVVGALVYKAARPRR